MAGLFTEQVGMGIAIGAGCRNYRGYITRRKETPRASTNPGRVASSEDSGYIGGQMITIKEKMMVIGLFVLAIILALLLGLYHYV